MKPLDTNKERIGDVLDFVPKDLLYYDEDDNEYYIETLEGNHKCTEGDYIIKGVANEFYSCKPDIFAKTYELVEEIMRSGVSFSGEFSDGHHTINELYHHRTILFAVLCSKNQNIAWKSKKHHDGSGCADTMLLIQGVYGEFDTWLKAKIESTVSKNH